MVLSGNLARPYQCLRCQLREVLHRTILQDTPQRQKPPCRSFSNVPKLCQESGDSLLEKRKPYYWKHVHGGERVVGRPGKWQRVVSEGLTSTSLGKPSNVIVLRDLEGDPKTTETSKISRGQEQYLATSDASRNSLSAKDIENAVTGRYAAPKDSEVRASIDALRPENTVVEHNAYKSLKETLLRSYTYQQLKRYMVSSLQDAAATIKARNVQELETTRWQAGQTPLQKRHETAFKDVGTTRKSTLAEQILRLVWDLTVHSEAREIGEVEIRLQKWQLSLLFDVYENGRPYYESLIGSSSLLSVCELHAWSPDSTLRITACRSDAEAVARILKLALLESSREELDLKHFTPLIANETISDGLGRVFSDNNLRHVTELTKSIVEVQANGIIQINGLRKTATSNARRLLISLLGLRSPSSLHETSLVVADIARNRSRAEKRPLASTSFDSARVGLHRKHRELELVRLSALIAPVNLDHPSQDGVRSALMRQKNAYTVKDDGKLDHVAINEAGLASCISPLVDIDRLSSALGSKLDNMPDLKIATFVGKHAESYWDEQPRTSHWAAEFCTLLSEPIGKKARASPGETDARSGFLSQQMAMSNYRAIVNHNVPGADIVLSYFETFGAAQQSNAVSPDENQASLVATESRKNFDLRMPYFSAHFVPVTPPGSSMALPRVEMRFRLLSARKEDNGRQILALTKIKADLDRQVLDVPVPQCAMDVRFSRDLSLMVQVGMARKDGSIRGFIRKLQDSINAGDGALHAPSQITLLLPYWLMHEDGKPGHAVKEDVTVTYEFEHFEQTQRIVFNIPEHSKAPMNDEMQPVIDTLPKDTLLDYREIEGGAIHGQRTILSISNRGGVTPPSADPVDASSHRLSAAIDEPEQDTALSSDDIERGAGNDGWGAKVQGRLPDSAGDSHELHQSTGDSRAVEQPEKLSQESNNSNAELATAALRFASVLTRANAGSLHQMAENRFL